MCWLFCCDSCLWCRWIFVCLCGCGCVMCGSLFLVWFWWLMCCLMWRMYGWVCVWWVCVVVWWVWLWVCVCSWWVLYVWVCWVGFLVLCWWLGLYGWIGWFIMSWLCWSSGGCYGCIVICLCCVWWGWVVGVCDVLFGCRGVRLCVGCVWFSCWWLVYLRWFWG